MKSMSWATDHAPCLLTNGEVWQQQNIKLCLKM